MSPEINIKPRPGIKSRSNDITAGVPSAQSVKLVTSLPEVKKRLLSEGIPINKVDYLYDTCINAKYKLMNMLGMNYENGFRISFDYTPTDDDFEYDYNDNDNDLSEVLTSIRGFMKNELRIATLSLVNNRYTLMGDKNEYKVSKYLNSGAKDVIEYINDAAGYKMVDAAFGFEITPKNLTTAIMAAIKPRKVYISANPGDIILNSSKSWGNCYNPRGGYFSACTAHASDNFSILIYVLRSGVGIDEYPRERYSGRAWCYFIADNHKVAISRSYADLPYNLKAAAVRHMTSLMDKAAGKSMDWQYSDFTIAEPESCDRSPVYFDGESHSMVTARVKRHRDINEDDLLFTKGICLICGKEQPRSTEDGVCSGCRPYEVCHKCGMSHPSKSMIKIYKGSDNFNAITSPPRMYCKTCATDMSSRCSGCGNHFHDTTRMFKIGDNSYCPECREKQLVSCSGCGEYVMRSDKKARYINGKIHCSKCCDRLLSEGKLSKCSSCGKIIEGDGLCAVCKLYVEDKCPVCGRSDSIKFVWSVKLSRHIPVCDNCSGGGVTANPLRVDKKRFLTKTTA